MPPANWAPLVGFENTDRSPIFPHSLIDQRLDDLEIPGWLNDRNIEFAVLRMRDSNSGGNVYAPQTNGGIRTDQERNYFWKRNYSLRFRVNRRQALLKFVDFSLRLKGFAGLPGTLKCLSDKKIF